MSVTRIAVYDLDRTVTRMPTYSHFLLHAARRIAPWRLLLVPIVPVLMLTYAAKMVSRDALKSLMWRVMLGSAHPDGLNRAIASFVRWTLAENIRPGARRQIAEDISDGAMLVLATAAQELYARPIAEALGFDAVVATRMQVADSGHIGPSLGSANIYGKAKLAALKALLAELGVSRDEVQMSFYSDSSSDRPVFEWVDHPVAVAPSRKLARMARQQSWPIESWTDLT